MWRAIGVGVCLCTGCEPVDAEVWVGDWALSFSGDGCVQSTSDAVPLGSSLTLEAWVLASETPASEGGAIITLGTAVMLYADVDATGLTQPSVEDGTGWQTSASIYDGEPHHLAATWSAVDGGNIFVDGVRSGTGSPWTVLPAIADIHIGCSTDGERQFSGVIDEVRVSTAVRYPTNFEVPAGPLPTDELTLAHWHLDAGTGTAALDEQDHFNAVVDGPVWVDGLVTAAD